MNINSIKDKMNELLDKAYKVGYNDGIEFSEEAHACAMDYKPDEDNSTQGRKRGVNMTDIELVIKISEDDYKEVKEGTYSGTPFENRVFSSIANGIQLPRRHGDLIDRGMLPTNYITNDDIADASVIIKADKAEREE